MGKPRREMTAEEKRRDNQSRYASKLRRATRLRLAEKIESPPEPAVELAERVRCKCGGWWERRPGSPTFVHLKRSSTCVAAPPRARPLQE